MLLLNYRLNGNLISFQFILDDCLKNVFQVNQKLYQFAYLIFFARQHLTVPR